MRKGQTSHKKEHNTRMCFPLKPVFTRDKGGLPNFMDEATASVDPENEHLIQAAISELTKEKTIVTIAHRLVTIEQADHRFLPVPVLFQ